jgi:transcription initiation factor TFIIF subunit beta
MDQKTTRMPKNELMDLLFTAFEQYPYWSFKGLVEYVKQPQTYLKDVLAEICNFIKKGPYTAKYQLKPEFAGGAGRSTGGSSSSSARPASGVANAELETTFNPAAVGVGSGETATQSEAAIQEEVDDDDEDFDEDDEEMVEVE